MNSFKDIAHQILKEAGKPLHSKEITKIVYIEGPKTVGKTSEMIQQSMAEHSFLHFVSQSINGPAQILGIDISRSTTHHVAIVSREQDQFCEKNLSK